MKLSPLFALAANASILQFDYEQYEVQGTVQRAKRTTDEETVANSYRKVFFIFASYFAQILNQILIIMVLYDQFKNAWQQPARI